MTGATSPAKGTRVKTKICAFVAVIGKFALSKRQVEKKREEDVCDCPQTGVPSSEMCVVSLRRQERAWSPVPNKTFISFGWWYPTALKIRYGKNSAKAAESKHCTFGVGCARRKTAIGASVASCCFSFYTKKRRLLLRISVAAALFGR